MGGVMGRGNALVIQVPEKRKHANVQQIQGKEGAC